MHELINELESAQRPHPFKHVVLTVPLTRSQEPTPQGVSCFGAAKCGLWCSHRVRPAQQYNSAYCFICRFGVPQGLPLNVSSPKISN